MPTSTPRPALRGRTLALLLLALGVGACRTDPTPTTAPPAAAPAAKKTASEPAGPAQTGPVDDSVYAGQIANAVEEIKRFIQDELKALREELHLIQK